jgi:hypothetical protein
MAGKRYTSQASIKSQMETGCQILIKFPRIIDCCVADFQVVFYACFLSSFAPT